MTEISSGNRRAAKRLLCDVNKLNSVLKREVIIMQKEKLAKRPALGEVLQIRTTPQIEAALAEKIRTIPDLVIEKLERGIKASSLGLVVCCCG